MHITVISDTHGKENQLVFEEYKGNDKTMLIHCGDFQTHKPNTQEFLFWFSRQKFDYLLLVAGNHDSLIAVMGYEAAFKLCADLNIIYLEDTSIEIEGIKFHGSPWSTRFGDWSFMNSDENLEEFWQKIPNDVEVLITHALPYNTLDKVEFSFGGDNHVGSRTLEERVKELKKLRFHIGGHLHEDHGELKKDGINYINASSFDWNKWKNSRVLNKPITFSL